MKISHSAELRESTDSIDTRDKLIDLIFSHANHAICHARFYQDNTIIFTEFPKRENVLVLHKKYAMVNNVIFGSQSDNTCVERTLLGDRFYRYQVIKRYCLTKRV